MADRNDGIPGVPGINARYVDLSAGTYVPGVAILDEAPDVLVNDAALNASSKTFTVPGSTLWEPLFIAVTLVTTATVGNRKMRLEIGDGTNLWWFKEWTPTQAASLTRNYFAGISLPDDAAFDTNGRARMLYEARFTLPAAWTMKFFDVAAIDAAADDMTVKVLGDSRGG